MKREQISRGTATRKEQEKKLREAIWRLTAPVHVTINSYKQHQRVEGYYEFKDYQHIFKCDRLLKLETAYGRVQMGYNPNKRRSFLFAHMKTNLYDTVSSGYQKRMKEYQQQAELKQKGTTKAFVSGRKENAAVLLEKEEYKPWAERSIQRYFHRKNMEVILKTMPFFQQEQEKEELRQNRERIHWLQEKVRENGLQGAYNQNAPLQEEIRQLSMEAELLHSILYRKNTGQRGFLRKLNYAFDIEKKEMFHYYREQRWRACREERAVIYSPGEGENHPESEKQHLTEGRV